MLTGASRNPGSNVRRRERSDSGASFAVEGESAPGLEASNAGADAVSTLRPQLAEFATAAILQTGGHETSASD